MVEQNIIDVSKDYLKLDAYLVKSEYKRIFLVCDSSLQFLKISEYFDKLERRLGIHIAKFNDFAPNPSYESVVKGVDALHVDKSDVIFAVGGGSAIDVAKCIKLYSNMDSNCNYLEQKIVSNNLELIALPTTAGTGSEATRYAVIYFEGEKQSVTHNSIIPSTVIFDSSVLKTLPEYQKKSTMMDALCHAVESFWSVNSTIESKTYSKQAIRLILENMEAYLSNDESGNANMLVAANMAGKAINITQTTAGHAMCYKLTSLYGVAHGHAAAVVNKALFPWMVNNIDKCVDPRGGKYVLETFQEIAEAMGCNTIDEAVRKLSTLIESLRFKSLCPNNADYDVLNKSVNPVRLKNNPVELSMEDINELYHEMLK